MVILPVFFFGEEAVVVVLVHSGEVGLYVLVSVFGLADEEEAAELDVVNRGLNLCVMSERME